MPVDQDWNVCCGGAWEDLKPCPPYANLCPRMPSRNHPLPVLQGNTTRSFGDTHQAHGRYFEFKGQWFHVWCEFVSENNTGTTTSKHHFSYRDSWMTYACAPARIL